MRRRADRDRMRKRVQPSRWPVYWAIPEHRVLDQAWLDEELRDAVRRLRLPHGCDAEMTLLQEHLIGDSQHAYVVQIRPVPRRDTSHRRETRWLSETPRGPRDD